MEITFGYARISTKSQVITRQIENIKRECPTAKIVQEVFTGTKIDGRQEFNKLLKQAKELNNKGNHVTIIFDSVSRMSRNSQEGFNLYQELYNEGIDLIFLKEPQVNTTKYKEALKKSFEMTGDIVDYILEGINKYNMALVKRDIEIAFDQAQKEVDDLRQRTKEGIAIARVEGKRTDGTWGTKKGTKLTTKKELEAKKKMREFLLDPNNKLKDKDIMALVGVTRNTYYKYKKEIMEEVTK